MGVLKQEWEKLTKEAENRAEKGDRYRQKFHLMPPTGWLNDPNGLCQFQRKYHAFFQYSPFDAEGGLKMWGHYTSRNMMEWEYEGAALFPDQPFDCHGVYSGCAFLENEKMYLFYTGNVKWEDRKYDYISEGREANTVLTVSEDGKTFGPKKLLMRNSDYPAELSCHVRDPKVWKEGGKYYMVQGARSLENEGKAILFESDDLMRWNFLKNISCAEGFGYMWECPDYFEIGEKKLLSASVQGLCGEAWRERNLYQSGYFFVEGVLQAEYSLSEYQLWDYGFDYYAPQTFADEAGRRIQIGWMGMPDCEEHINPTREAGWQHCFTFPREILVKDEKVLQRPVQELEAFRKNKKNASGRLESSGCRTYDLCISRIQGERFRAVLAEELVLGYEAGIFSMRFLRTEKQAVSGGRKKRSCRIDRLDMVRILSDVSSVEVFLNDGERVLSTRYYPETYSVVCEAPEAEIEFWEL